MAASGGSGQRRLGVALYRALLRWGRANADVPFTLRASEVYALAPELRGTALALQDSAAVGPIARAAFEASRRASGEEQAAALDRGIEGVRLLNTVYAQQIKDMRETRRDREDRTGVKFAVGQVVVHKKYGYRATIFGWDRECQRDEEWMRQMNVGNARQPFYYCLPDETDSVRLFGGVRITKYVAQENMEPVESRVVHRALDSYFSSYSVALKRYIPIRKLQYEYPDRYDADDLAPVGDDANLLAHEEVEPLQRPPFPPGRPDSRSLASAEP